MTSSSQATSLIEKISGELLVCRYCRQPLKQPKSLACRHSFCEDCLYEMIATSGDRHHVTCPVCTTLSVLPPGGVRRLPDDPMVARLNDVIEQRRKLTTGVGGAVDDGTDGGRKLCDICSHSHGGGDVFGARHKVALCRCLDCFKLLCSGCTRLHRRTKVTSGHSLIDLDAMTSACCQLHDNEAVRFYCDQCEVPVCVLCTYGDHAGHSMTSFGEAVASRRELMASTAEECRVELDRSRRRLENMERLENEICQACTTDGQTSEGTHVNHTSINQWSDSERASPIQYSDAFMSNCRLCTVLCRHIVPTSVTRGSHVCHASYSGRKGGSDGEDDTCSALADTSFVQVSVEYVRSCMEHSDCWQYIGEKVIEAENAISEAALETVSYVRSRERELLAALRTAFYQHHQVDIVTNVDHSKSKSTLADTVRQLTDLCHATDCLLSDVDRGGAMTFLLARQELLKSMTSLIEHQRDLRGKDEGSSALNSASSSQGPSQGPSQGGASQVKFVPFGVTSAMSLLLGRISVEGDPNEREDMPSPWQQQPCSNGANCSSSCDSTLCPDEAEESFDELIVVRKRKRMKSDTDSSGKDPKLDKTPSIGDTNGQSTRAGQCNGCEKTPATSSSCSVTTGRPSAVGHSVETQTDGSSGIMTSSTMKCCDAAATSAFAPCSSGPPTNRSGDSEGGGMRSVPDVGTGRAGLFDVRSTSSGTLSRLVTRRVQTDGVISRDSATETYSSPTHDKSTTCYGSSWCPVTVDRSTMTSVLFRHPRNDRSTTTDWLVITRDQETSTMPPVAINSGTQADRPQTRSRMVDVRPEMSNKSTSTSRLIVTPSEGETTRSKAVLVDVAVGDDEAIRSTDDEVKPGANIGELVEQRVERSVSTQLPSVDSVSCADIEKSAVSATTLDCDITKDSNLLTRLIKLLPEIVQTAEVLTASHFVSGLTARMLFEVADIARRMQLSSSSECVPRISQDVATGTEDGDDTLHTAAEKDAVDEGDGLRDDGLSSTHRKEMIDCAVGDDVASVVDIATGNDQPTSTDRACGSDHDQRSLAVDRGVGDSLAGTSDQATMAGYSRPMMFDKETSMARGHVLHKNVGTDSQSTADKQTSTSVVDVAAVYLGSASMLSTTRRSVTVSRGTCTPPLQQLQQQLSRHSADVVSRTDRASSPIPISRSDKSVSASRGEALEPLDTFQTTASPSSSPRGRRSLVLSPRSKLACISEAASDDELGAGSGSVGDENSLASSTVMPPLSSINSRIVAARSLNRGIGSNSSMSPSSTIRCGVTSLPRPVLGRQRPSLPQSPLRVPLIAAIPPLSRSVFDFENVTSGAASAKTAAAELVSRPRALAGTAIGFRRQPLPTKSSSLPDFSVFPTLMPPIEHYQLRRQPELSTVVGCNQLSSSAVAIAVPSSESNQSDLSISSTQTQT